MRSVSQEEKIIRETKELVELFLQTNASDIELSKMTGISSSTVGRRLTNVQNISKAFPLNGLELSRQIKTKRQENLLHGKALGGQTTLINHVYLQQEDGKFNGATKLRLDILAKDENTIYRILMHAALTFRLHPDTLSEMFQIDEKELYEKLLNVSGNCYDAMMFLFYHDGRSQSKAKSDFLDFYRALLNAIRNKDIDEKKRVIGMVSDARASEFKKRNRIDGEKISDEEIYVLIKYQVKYALNGEIMARIFNINRTTYVSRVSKILDSDEELKELYLYLVDYNKNKRFGTKRGG